MEQINLNAIAKAYHANEAKKAKKRATALVDNEIVPLLQSAASAGQFSCKVEIKQKDVYIGDVQNEIAKRVKCRFSGYGKSFTVHW